MNTLTMAAMVLLTTIDAVNDLVGYLAGKDDGYASIEYVDLKLTSKTLWATCNVGAERPEDAGYYFAWGEIVTKETFSSSNYRPVYREAFPSGTYVTYPLLLGDLLPLKADAAHQMWHAGWEMPTLEQINELVDECHWAWTKVNGVSGYRVYSYDFKRSIFLPCSGSRNESGEIESYGMSGSIWTKETAHGSSDKGKCYVLNYDSGFQHWVVRPPQNGYTIRPVTQSVTSRFDFNGDGKVTIADLTELIRQTLVSSSL